MFGHKHKAKNDNAAKPKVWTVDEFIATYLGMPPSDVTAENMAKIKDRVNRFNVLIPELGDGILDSDESGLQELLDVVNVGQKRAEKYPNVYKMLGGAICDDEIKEEDLKYLEKAATKYSYALMAYGLDGVLDEYRDEDKLKQANEQLKQEAQSELAEQLQGDGEEKDEAQPNARRPGGCSIC